MKSSLDSQINCKQNSGMNMKRKSSRRSSILKVPRPLDDMCNASADERFMKNKRVSFASKIEIKTIQARQTTHATGTVDVPRDENAQPATEDSEPMIQISTPKGGKKRRRISADTGSKLQRLSIIPKLDNTNFSLTDDDFEVYQDSGNEDEKTAENHVTDDAVNPAQDKTVTGNVSMNMTTGVPIASFLPFSPRDILQGSSAQECITHAATEGRGESKRTMHKSAKMNLTCNTTLGGLIRFPETSSLLSHHSEASLNLTCTDQGGQEPSRAERTFVVDQAPATTTELHTVPSPEHIAAHDTSKVHVHPEADRGTSNSSVPLDLTCEESLAVTFLNIADTDVDHAGVTLKDDGDQSYDHTNATPRDTTFAREADVAAAVVPTPVSLGIDIEKCDNWLQNTSNNFLVADVSTTSQSENEEENPIPTNPIAVVPAEISSVEGGMGDRLSRLKQGVRGNVMDPTIATPEAVPVKPALNVSLKQPCPSDPVEPELSESTTVNKSVIPSPSAYSKFCAFLNCDHTVLETTHFPSPKYKSSNVEQEQAMDPQSEMYAPTESFFSHLEALEARVLNVQKSLQLRLSDTDYTSCHGGIATALKILLKACLQALCAVVLMKGYGALCAHLEPHTGTPIPHVSKESPTNCEDDLTGPLASKIQWISQMHSFLSEQLYPSIEEAMGIAQGVYSWTLNMLDQDSVLLTLARDHQVSFQLTHPQDWENTSPTNKVVSVHIQSSGGDSEPLLWKASLINCTHISEIPKAVFEAQKFISAQK